MLKSGKRTSLVISPVYNEEAYLLEFYPRLRACYKRDVLFVDDGSTDLSRDYLIKMKDSSTFILRHPQRRGYGAALFSGFEFALEKNYQQIVTIDVDLQHKPEQVSEFLAHLEDRDVVLGSRYIRISKPLEVPPLRITINRYISRLFETLFFKEFTDPFCGFRAYRDSFLRKIQLTEKGYGISLEILLELICTDASFIEIPVEAIYFKDRREFLDGLDDARIRLLYYLEVISRKRRSINEEKILGGKSSS